MVGIGEVHGGFWSETRPEEGGRTAVLSASGEVTPPEANVRTLVHEYGGGAWWADGDDLYWVDFADQRLRRTSTDGDITFLTPEPPTPRGVRYADGRVVPDGGWSICVRERHDTGGEPANEIVAVPHDGSFDVRVLWSGADFVSSPRVSGSGDMLAFISWDHPEMPWTRTCLHVYAVNGVDLGDELLRLDGDRAFCEPGWDRDRLLVVVDDDEWWNLYDVDLAGGELTGLVTGPFDIATPPWVFGMQRWAVVPDDEGRRRVVIVVAALATGDELIIDGQTSTTVDSSISHLSAHQGKVSFVGAGYDHESELVELRIRDGRPRRDVIRASRSLPFDRGFLVEPEWVSFPTGPDGAAEAHALFYPPANPEHIAPADERPPLLVLAHGGPTAQARRQLQLQILFWTSRGIAVVDVDYRGSTGYGRTYRQALDSQWGIADVQDCVTAASHLARRGVVDGDRLMIRGGSAGGFTVLCALAFHDVFAAGAIRYGVADLEALATGTHKFEARYLDSLVGPYPEAKDVYAARSPINHVDLLRAPVIVLQGDEDEIVPPNQSEMIVDALRAKGVEVEYLLFEGEQHGFRKSENIIAAFEAELAFFGRILGFEPA